MFTVGTLNIKCAPPMRQALLEEDVDLAAEHCDVIFWQEIGIDRYKDEIRALAPVFESFIPDGLGNSDPISWNPKKFEFIEGGATFLHDHPKSGGARRAITYVVLRRKGTRKRYVFNNVHYVARAWHPDGSARLRNDAEIAAEQPERQVLWLEGNKRHKAFIQKWIDKGYTVIGGGDYNRAGSYPVVGRAFSGFPVRYLTNGGLDYLWVCHPGKTKFNHLFTNRFNANSDHDLKVAGVAFVRRLFRR